MNLLKFKSKIPKDVELVSDIDAIITETIYFQLHGKVRAIKPMSAEQFLKYSLALSKLYSLRERKGLTGDELVEAYFELANSVIDDITKDDIRKLTQAQVSGLYTLILKSVTGEIQAEKDEKKKMKESQPE